MMCTSRDYTFTKLLDHRFTQYQCPACSSYHVAIVSVANWADASSNVAIGEGEMECQLCDLVEKGKRFQVHTQAHEDGDLLQSLMEKMMQETGDKWRDLHSKNYRF